jgi:nocardicin N-oxygenase
MTNGDVDFVLDVRQDTVVAAAFERDLLSLREAKGPVLRAHFPFGGDGWIAVGYAEAREVLEDPRFAIRHKVLEYPRMRPVPGGRPPAPASFPSLDGPEHVRKRRVFTKHLSVRRVMSFKEETGKIADGLLDSIEAQGHGADIIADFALKLPLAVLSVVLGVPEGEGIHFEQEALDLLGGRVTSEADAVAKMTVIHDYFATLVEVKRKAPQEDLLSALVQEVDATAAWSPEELAGFGFVALAAGHDAPSSILSGITYWLAHHPDLVRRLRDDLEETPAAIEEFLRFLPAGYGLQTRLATEDIQLGDVLVKQGETVMAVVHLANYDDRVFSRPTTFDMDVERPPHLLFGSGPHVCPGNQLARMELDVATRALVTRFPGLRPFEARDDWREGLLMRGPKNLKVAW